jgi:hypothetical protein
VVATALAILALILAGAASVVIQLDELWSWVIAIALIVAVVLLAWRAVVNFVRARDASTLRPGSRPGPDR